MSLSAAKGATLVRLGVGSAIEVDAPAGDTIHIEGLSIVQLPRGQPSPQEQRPRREQQISTCAELDQISACADLDQISATPDLVQISASTPLPKASSEGHERRTLPAAAAAAAAASDADGRAESEAAGYAVCVRRGELVLTRCAVRAVASGCVFASGAAVVDLRCCELQRAAAHGLLVSGRARAALRHCQVSVHTCQVSMHRCMRARACACVRVRASR